jgi:bifunctional DNA-binding transcriptional regulator/antitoxin component of YhaV-PrlF toxin-antitoxin module
MPALQTAPKVNPRIAGLQAFLTTLGPWRRVVGGAEVLANVHGRARYRSAGPLRTQQTGSPKCKRRLAHRTGKTLSYETMKTTMSSKGQIVLAAEFGELDHIEPGDEFTVERLGRGEYRLVRRISPSNEGVVDWLLSCPERGFFVPIESESTDTL